MAGAVVSTILSLVLLFNRARLIQHIKQAESELKHARDHSGVEGGRVAAQPHQAIVSAHDRLVHYRHDLRQTNEYARTSRFILVPLLAGSFIGGGYTVGALRNLNGGEQVGARFEKLEQELDDWRAKGRSKEKKFALQATLNARMTEVVQKQAREKETLQDRLAKVEALLANEKKERIELEMLVGKAEQRLAVIEESNDPKTVEPDSFRTITEASSSLEDLDEPDATLDVSLEPPLEESDLSADDRVGSLGEATSLYTGRLKGQIAFEDRQRKSVADWNRRHIYVLVRWGESSWIVTEGRARVNAAGAVEGAFRVILPIGTIRTLDVTAIATDRVYRRYQFVRLPDHKWKASTATIAVHRS